MEGQLVTKEIVGNAQIGTGGLGLRPRKKQSLKEKRKELVKLMKEDAESKRIVDVGCYEIQAKWLSVGIDNMQHKDLTWKKILYQCSDRLLKFIVNAIPGWLPSPDNLRRWNAPGIHNVDFVAKSMQPLHIFMATQLYPRHLGRCNQTQAQNHQQQLTFKHHCTGSLRACR